jgi:hypothetical protein
MAVTYSLVENTLNSQIKNYTAKTVNTRSYGLDEIIDLIVRGGTTLTKADLNAAMTAFNSVVANIIADGGAVNTPLFNTQPSISGTFDNPSENFNPIKHRLNANFTAGVLAKEAINKAVAHKIDAPIVSSQITGIIDTKTGKTNELLSPNYPIEIIGSKVKIIGGEEAGVYFVNERGEEFKSGLIVKNDPKSVLAMIPPLEENPYMVMIKTNYSGNNRPLKELRTIRFNKWLKIIN